MTTISSRLNSIRERLNRPPQPTPEQIRNREYREHKESLAQYGEYTPWDLYWDEAYERLRAELGSNLDLIRARARVLKSNDARELCEFFELGKVPSLEP